MPENREAGPNDNRGDAADAAELDFIYKIEGTPNEVDVFELARVLDSLGNILRESYQVVSEPNGGEVVVKVKPFEPGSFLMDLALQVHQSAGYLFPVSQTEAFQHMKDVLEYLGYIRKAREFGASLLELLRGLKDGKPDKIERKGPDLYEYTARDGSVIAVNSKVNALYNNSVINNFTINVVAPAQHDFVPGIQTYLKDAPEQTSVTIGKDDVAAVRAYSAPPEPTTKVEVLEDTTTKVLHPKSGNYGQTEGVWTFTIAGTKRTIKAKIEHNDFLNKYSTGTIRFYQGDSLKVRLRERQIIEGVKTRMEYAIVEVLEYHQASP